MREGVSRLEEAFINSSNNSYELFQKKLFIFVDSSPHSPDFPTPLPLQTHTHRSYDDPSVDIQCLVPAVANVQIEFGHRGS